jgi:hypothetical protein
VVPIYRDRAGSDGQGSCARIVQVALFRSAVLVLLLSQLGVFDSNRESDVPSIHRMRGDARRARYQSRNPRVLRRDSAYRRQDDEGSVGTNYSPIGPRSAHLGQKAISNQSTRSSAGFSAQFAHWGRGLISQQTSVRGLDRDGPMGRMYCWYLCSSRATFYNWALCEPPCCHHALPPSFPSTL